MAEEKILRAIQHLEEAEEWQKLAALVTAEAKPLVYAGQLRRVEQVLETLLRIDPLPPPSSLASLYQVMGFVQRTAGKYELSHNHYQKALKITHNKANRGDIHYEIGLTFEEQGDYRSELAAHQQSLAEFQQAQLDEGIAKATFGIGRAHYMIGELATAQPHIVSSREMATENHDELLVARCDLIWGLIDWRHQRVDDAETRMKHACTIFQRFGEKKPEAHAMINLGILAGEKGKLDEKLAWYLDALALSEEIGDIASLRILYHNLGYFYLTDGKPTEALTFYEKQIQLDIETEHKPLLVYAYTGCGEAYMALSDLASASDYANRALSVADSIQQDPQIGAANRVLGEIALAQNKGTQARTFFEKSIVHLEKCQDQQELALAQAGLQKIQEC